MDLLIVEPLEQEVAQWLAERHDTTLAPWLMHAPSTALRQAVSQARAVIVAPSVAIDAHVLAHAPHLRAIGQISAGAENVDIEACLQVGVEVVRSASATAQAEAEFMVGALVTLMRRSPVMGSNGLLVGRELGASKIGLIGMVPAAQALSQLLGAFGTRVAGYDPSVHASDPVWQRWGIEPMPLVDLLEDCDGLCVPLHFFTRYRGLLGQRLLPHCKPHQVIVNVSHSALFDEQALADVLNSGRVCAAWFDSMEPGALDAGRPLAGIAGLQVTPRVASTTRESRLRSAWAVAKGIHEVLVASASGSRREFRPSGPNALLDLANDHGSP